MLIYLVKSAIGMCLCMALFRFFLYKGKSFLFNRFFLMAGLVGACAAPLVTFSILPTTPSTALMFTSIGPTQSTEYVAFSADEGRRFWSNTGLYESLIVVYWGISLLLMGRLFNYLIRITNSVLTKCKMHEGGMRIMITNDLNTPYSFFNCLFIDHSTFEKGIISNILLHEQCHARHWHTIDRIIIEIVTIFFWWNPGIYFLKRAIKENHEYTADQYVLQRQSNIKDYINEVLRYATNQQPAKLLHIPFAHISVSKRINMITSSSSFTPLRIKSFTVVALLCTFLACSDFSESEAHTGFSKDQLSIVFSEELQTHSVYPTIFHEQAEELGFHVPYGIIPEYRSPSLALYNKWKDSRFFQIEIDGQEVDNAELSKYRESDIKGYRVRGDDKLTEQETYTAHLFTHQGYLDNANRAFVVFKDWKKKQERLDPQVLE